MSNTNVHIVDSIMGSGKTTAAINFINSSDDDRKFLYITPYLDEVDRIIKNCSDKKFRQPGGGSKLRDIKDKLRNGVNIASTHSLFSMYDQEVADLIYANNYTLIMDEVTEVIDEYELAALDLKILVEMLGFAKVDGFLLKWIDENYKKEKGEKYNLKYGEIKSLCDFDSLAVFKSKLVFWLFPAKIFQSFKEVYILTYMFNAQYQKYYFDIYGVEYDYLYVKDFNFTYEVTLYENNMRNLINIIDNEKLNRIGDKDYTLSMGWYEREINDNGEPGNLIKILKKNTYNFFKNYSKTKTEYNLWTTFKDYRKYIAGLGYAKGFLSMNMRSTNDYRERTAVAYLVNRFPIPWYINFFTANGAICNEDNYALSEMLQFIWRSAIRDGKQIDLYIPSARMRNLLTNWMNA